MELLVNGKNVMLIGRGNVKGWSDFERYYPCPCFGKAGRDKSSVSTHNTSFLIGPLP